MLDPFPFAPPQFLINATKPVADYLSLPTLPLHVHEVIFAIVVYQLIFSTFSPIISTYLFPNTYPQFNKRTRINWNVHVVSLVQSLVISIWGLYLMVYDDERREMNWAGRIWGYTGASGLLQGLATGYFIWDLIVTAMHVDIFGYGMLAHATAATTVFTLGFRPFVNYYGPVFILYELSTPFNNVHWFLDKLHLTGSMYQWVNGIILIVTFFLCRLVWGGINSYFVFADMFSAFNAGRVFGNSDLGLKLGLGDSAPTASGDEMNATNAQIMRFAGDKTLPLWLAMSYLASNIVLNLLNYYWMNKMIETIRKRFDPPFGTKGVGEKSEHEKMEARNEEGKKEEIEVQRGVYADGRKTVEVGGQVRNRRKG